MSHPAAESFARQPWSANEMAPTMMKQISYPQNDWNWSNSLSFPVPPPNNREQYYNLQKVNNNTKKFSCEVCNKSFFTHGQYKRHVDEHVECPFPECKLSAHIKVIDQHISHQHMLVNFEALQMDDEAWIAERKKRFPSVQRASLRRAEQMERLKRGERLGLEKKKLLKNSSNKGHQIKSNQFDSKGGGNKVKRNDHVSNVNNLATKEEEIRVKSNYPANDNQIREERKPYVRLKREWKPRQERVEFVVDLYDSDTESKRGVPAFKGTKAYYESTGELSLFGFQNSKSFIDAEAAEISDEDEWDGSYMQNESKKINLQNALGSLIGSYNSDSDSGSDTQNAPSSSKLIVTVNTSNDLPKKDDIVASQSFVSSKRKRKHFRGNNRKHNNPKRQASDNTTNNGFRLKMKPHKPIKRRRPTLLQKLLEPDITHERNIILQCIRYIVDNNFFEETSTTNETPIATCAPDLESPAIKDQSQVQSHNSIDENISVHESQLNLQNEIDNDTEFLPKGDKLMLQSVGDNRENSSSIKDKDHER